MLTLAQYTALWAIFGPVAGGPPMPPYLDYVTREKMLEDYLDIFRGHNTRGHRGEPPGFVYEWDHPYLEVLGVHPGPKIKYIVIAEAAVPGALTYFYNINHLDGTPYLDSVRIWRGCGDRPTNNVEKRDLLICLANQGVLLLDLFSFALNYNPGIRHGINAAGLTLHYWNGGTPAGIAPIILAPPESIQSRINSIAHLLHDEWDLALVAPCVISRFILRDPPHVAGSFPPIVVHPGPAGLHPAVFYNLFPDPTRCPHPPHGPSDYQKIAVAQRGPTPHLVNIAL